MFDFFSEVTKAVFWTWFLKTYPGWIMLIVDGGLAFAIARKHRNPNSGYRFSLAYFQDAALTIVMLVLLIVGLGVLLGWLKVG